MGQRDNVSYIGLVRNLIRCREENVMLPAQALGTILTSSTCFARSGQALYFQAES